MRYTPALIAALLPGASLAHPGHLVEVAGHNHWLAGAAIAAAAAIALAAAIRKGIKSGEADADSDEAPEDETEEAAA